MRRRTHPPSQSEAAGAHELNQPLTAIANDAQACDRLLGRPTPQIQHAILNLVRNGHTVVRAHGGNLTHRPNTPADACFAIRVPAET